MKIHSLALGLGLGLGLGLVTVACSGPAASAPGPDDAGPAAPDLTATGGRIAGTVIDLSQKGFQDCWPCLRKSSALTEAIAALETRTSAANGSKQ